MVDPLDGFRGRAEDDLSEQERIVKAVQGLHTQGVDFDLVREVVKSQQLNDEIERGGTLALLIHECSEKLQAAMVAWSMCDDPGSDEMRERHLEARSARIVLDWANQIATNGETAMRQIEMEEQRDE